jgi:hypothetical protein
MLKKLLASIVIISCFSGPVTASKGDLENTEKRADVVDLPPAEKRMSEEKREFWYDECRAAGIMFSAIALPSGWLAIGVIQEEAMPKYLKIPLAAVWAAFAIGFGLAAGGAFYEMFQLKKQA